MFFSPHRKSERRPHSVFAMHRTEDNGDTTKVLGGNNGGEQRGHHQSVKYNGKEQRERTTGKNNGKEQRERTTGKKEQRKERTTERTTGTPPKW
jgi:hypothetical protein